ncbi:hypothetical protein UFOVP75_122 [uncultured Caudovirales phage]|uniref:Uncharacterized protein n=1 Tax=uncultured Caudovirales phage TaxID=2100421 RepID=A0A6J5L5W6_9CAUD|nr:hypothetical protein UFOVP75_122 [uncultured Caudovirales phage]
MSDNGFGKPKYGGNFAQIKHFKLTEPKRGETTELIARIIPPIKSLAQAGKWFVYLPVCYGYKGRSKEDPQKLVQRPFLSIEDRDYKTQMIKVRCPQSDLINKNLERLEGLKKATTAECKAAGKSDEETKEHVKLVCTPLEDWKRQFNKDSKFHLNIMTIDGEFGEFAIVGKLKKKLEIEIKALLKDLEVDALDLDNGVFFKFTRTGAGIETAYDVVPYSKAEKVDGKIRTEMKMSCLTAEQRTAALAECPDLANLYTILNADQIQRLVDSDNDPDLVDAVFDEAARGRAPASTTPVVAVAKTETPPAAPKAQAVVEVAVAKAVAAPAAEDDEEAALLAQLKAAREKKAAAASAKVATPPPAEVVDGENLSTDDMLKLFGPGQG